MWRIGDCALGEIPRIAVPLSDADLEAHGALVRRYADLIELRIDRFARHDAAHLDATCRAARALGCPLIATIRAAAEGGATALSDAERLAAFETLVPAVDAVDIELRTPIRDRVVALAHRHGKLAIVSYHDFSGPISAPVLAGFADGAAGAGADVVKIAAHADSARDLDTLLHLLLERRAAGAIVIGMGPHGIASRVFFPLFGSLITYGFAEQCGAPGQLPLGDLHAALCRYSPAFAAAAGA